MIVFRVALLPSHEQHGVPTIARTLKGVLLDALARSGCPGPIAVMDPHADAGSGKYTIASASMRTARRAV